MRTGASLTRWPTLYFDRGLRVVALLETAAAHRHDAAFWVGGIDLVLRIGRVARGAWFLATGLFAGGSGGVAGGQFALIVGAFQGGAGLCAGLDLGARLSQFGFAFLTTLHLGGDRQAVAERGAVGVLGFAQELFDF